VEALLIEDDFGSLLKKLGKFGSETLLPLARPFVAAFAPEFLPALSASETLLRTEPSTAKELN
jgi:hypothetical protein